MHFSDLPVLLIGYSVFSAALLALLHFRPANYNGQRFARLMGIVFLLSLSILQLAHFAYLQTGSELIHGVAYRLALFMVAPSFYLFSAPLLRPQQPAGWARWLHFAPVSLAFILPDYVALPTAFLIGAGYLLWLGYVVFALRAQRHYFRLELAVLAVVFVIALAVTVLGFSMPLVPEKTFYALYASAIGVAFLLASGLLFARPQISEEVAEAARETYAVSTLANVDTDELLGRLTTLMKQEKLYRQPDLSLAFVAARLGVSPHQLSELINTRLGKGFSRFVREHRVQEARQILLNEVSVAVLSVGLAVGFSSQSNFYDAFREIEGTTPARYRAIHRTPE